jgi:hypothetical protein
MDFSKFDGENPANWFYKATQYFDFYQTQGMDNIPIASFHMEGEALIWFQDAEFSGLFNTWDTFAKACLVRFGPTAYDDPMESLTQLRQTKTVAAYKAQFEALSNRLRGLTEPYKLSCFLSGLKDEIRLPVRMLAHTSLGQAFGLVKIQEEYVLSSRRGLNSLVQPLIQLMENSINMVIRVMLENIIWFLGERKILILLLRQFPITYRFREFPLPK